MPLLRLEGSPVNHRIPLALYLCTLSITTSTVILAGTTAVHLSRTIDRMGNHSGHLGDPGNPPPTVDSPRRGVPVARAGGSHTVVDLTMVVQPPGPAYPLEPAAPGPWRRYEVTAYSHGCIMPRGPEGGPRKAADGRWPTPNWTVAAGPHYAFGTVLELSHRGIVTRRIVGDRGRAIKGRKLDLFVEDCGRARSWGRREVMVRVVREPLGGNNGE